MRVFGLFLIVFLMYSMLASAVMAQISNELSSDNRRALRAFERAEEAYRYYDYVTAKEELKRALDRDDAFIEAHLLLADIFFQHEKYEKSIEPWQAAIAIDSLFFPAAHHYLGVALLKNGRYEEAKNSFSTTISMNKLREAMMERSRKYLASCLFALDAIKNPVDFDPMNPGPSINSIYSEYSPALTADEQTLIFTRKIPLNGHTGKDRLIYHEDFFISHSREGSWSKAQNLGRPLNTDGNEGAQTITADGRHMYFTACNRPDGFGSCDIYYSHLRRGVYSRPVNVGRPLNSAAWESQPSVSADGNTIYFASNRPGSIGETDLWMATRSASGIWNEPENLGPVINTSGSELSPFIHHDNQTLYFASDGHPGMGGLDIFYSRRDEDGNWGKPVNIGYPINTHGDEFALIVGASGRHAWFASDKEGGYGESDLYTFELYPEARPQAVTYMKGLVFDSETGKPLGAAFELIDVQSGDVIISSESKPEDGAFLVAIPTGKELALNVSKTGYMFFSEYFFYENVKTAPEPYLENIPLQAIGDGHIVVLRNIFFETDSYELTPTSYPELEKLLLFLEQNPGISIEISGHTDDTGTFEYNLQLSEKRAGSVRDFLTNKGISAERINYKGYADTRPVDTNETEEGRANNRRTEFKIINKD